MSLSHEVNREDLLIGFDKKHLRFINIFLGTMGKGLTFTVGLQKKPNNLGIQYRGGG